MTIFQGMGRWFCAFLMSTALSAWIFVATLQVTVLDRGVVKSWLATSGVYNQALGNLVQVSTNNATTDSLVTGTVLQNALNKTFPPSYLQQNTNTVIDATYDWLEGKKNTITFNIPVQQKATEFSSNLANELEPVIAKLPTCGAFTIQSTVAATCIPKGISAANYAKQLTQPADSSDFLNTPLTQDNLGKGAPQYGALPAVVQWNHTLFWLLPIAWAVLGALYVLLSQDKLRGMSNVGRQATINSAITLAGGLLLWYASTSVDLSATLGQGDAQQSAIVKAIINPLARTILPDVSKALSLFSAIVFVIGLALWLGTFLWRRKIRKDVGQPDIPPAATHEAQLPTPASAPAHAQPHHAPVAQLDRALACGAKGRVFESRRAYHENS